jgi:hypothetical protein
MNAPRADPVHYQAQLSGQTVTIDPSKMMVRSIISTPQPDRTGDVILPEGLLNPEIYLRNPVVLWAHQRTIPPIGSCQYLEISPDHLLAETKFSSTSPLALDVFKLYAEGILRAWSIGFLPRKAFPRRGGGLLVEQWELLEYSAVPIPENPEALTYAIQKGFVRDPALIDWWTHDVLGALI